VLIGLLWLLLIVLLAHRHRLLSTLHAAPAGRSGSAGMPRRS
jgi:hypothetical protein